MTSACAILLVVFGFIFGAHAENRSSRFKIARLARGCVTRPTIVRAHALIRGMHAWDAEVIPAEPRTLTETG